MIEHKEIDIRQIFDEMMEIFKKMDSFIFDPSYRIIHSINDAIDEEDESLNE